MAQSKFGKINLRDAIHGFVVAFLSASLTGIIEALNTGHLPAWASVKVHLIVGLTSGLSYLLKQFLQNDKGQLMVKSSDEGTEGGVGNRPDDRKPGNP